MFKWLRDFLLDQTLYQILKKIKSNVDARIIYDNSGIAGVQLSDNTIVPRGMRGFGDCTVFAATYLDECMKNDLIYAELFTFKLPTGEWHEVCQVGKYTLDCRERVPVVR